MAYAMMFPATFDEFTEIFSFIDSKEYYTNGSELIQVFRVKQWLEHEANRQQAEVEKLKDSRDRWKRNALAFDEASRETEKELEKLYAEIERLNGCVKSEDEVRAIAKATIQAGIGIIKAEAIKEFAERLKRRFYACPDVNIYAANVHIDNLVKEMVGDAE